MRRTKIIATIGPASENISVIKKLVSAGLDVARLNMSHGDHATHKQRIINLRAASADIAIMIDLQGPKIRTGQLKDGHALLNSGSDMIITTKNIIGDSSIVSTNYKHIVNDVKAGDRVLIDDGLIELKVIRVTKVDVHCRIINGGTLKDHKGLNLPGVNVSARGVTNKDIEDLEFAVKNKVDYIAISFVRRVADVLKVKKLLKNRGAHIPVIAKIEKPEALQDLDNIIKAADAVMVARGDLGVELSPEKVPLVQKHIISRCNYLGKPVITATQMLESMVTNPRPTRAEASDISNAVFDGTDALMLSEEVAVGKFPVESVATMSRIASETESVIYTQEHKISESGQLDGIATAVGHAACHTAEELNAKVILTFTSSGKTALLVSKNKTDVPIYAVTTSHDTFRRVKLYFGVTPVMTDRFLDTDDMIKKAEKALLNMNVIKKGDIFVIVAGVPVGKAGSTNLIKVHRAGEVTRQ
jgi:pyruvate kinase